MAPEFNNRATAPLLSLTRTTPSSATFMPVRVRESTNGVKRSEFVASKMSIVYFSRSFA